MIFLFITVLAWEIFSNKKKQKNHSLIDEDSSSANNKREVGVYEYRIYTLGFNMELIIMHRSFNLLKFSSKRCSLPWRCQLNEFALLQRHHGACTNLWLIHLVISNCSMLSSTFAVRYTAKLEDGTIFEKKGFDGENPLQFITDEGQPNCNFFNLPFLNHHNGNLELSITSFCLYCL